MENNTIELQANVVVALVQIIDLGAKKGAFVGNDLSTVGEVRSMLVEKLQPFMQSEEEAQAE
jgi:hypothetical protein